MASPRELMAAADAKRARETPANPDEPDGFIRVAGRWMPVFLNGKTPEEIGLKSFIRDARMYRGKAA